MNAGYNEIQKQQLLSMTYYNTQDTKISIYVPERSFLLKSSLKEQIHLNYDLVITQQAVIQSDSSVVLLVKDDAELMNTALMYFVKAIQDGADCVFCDALYGGNKDTGCIFSEYNHESCGGILAVTKELFLTAIAQTEKEENCSELMFSVLRNAKCLTRIPFFLAAYRRSIQMSDLLKKEKKCILILCHEFSMTGAPIVLGNAAHSLKKNGYEVVVLGPECGQAMNLFLEYGIPVLINKKNLEEEELYSLAVCCDIVLANTVIEAKAVQRLSGGQNKVIWWLHDAGDLSYLDSIIPKQQGTNVKICAVGNRAVSAMQSVRPEFKITQLLYGLPDYSKEPSASFTYDKNDKLLFVHVGTIQKRKGQDILAKAIQMLKPEERRKAKFLFIGNVLEQQVFASIEDLLKCYPENVDYIQQLSRSEMKTLLRQCDCLICSSRDDPMPTVVTEAAMFGKPAIISENTGTAGLLQNGAEGWIYKNNSPAELCELIKAVIAAPEQVLKMKKNCKEFYERYFSEKVLEQSLLAIVKERE